MENNNNDFNKTFISFVSQTIVYGGMNYNRIYVKPARREIPLTSENLDTYRETVDKTLDEPENNNDEKINFEHIEDIITDEKLHAMIKSMSIRQKQILYFIFLKDCTEETAADIIGVSQQAVNKIKRNILKQLAMGYMK
jgi:DNA-directed RNA polymerase specialized sigma subunit